MQQAASNLSHSALGQIGPLVRARCQSKVEGVTFARTTPTRLFTPREPSTQFFPTPSRLTSPLRRASLCASASSFGLRAPNPPSTHPTEHHRAAAEIYAHDENCAQPTTSSPLLPRVLVGTGHHGSDSFRARSRQGTCFRSCSPHPRTGPCHPRPRRDGRLQIAAHMRAHIPLVP